MSQGPISSPFTFNKTSLWCLKSSSRWRSQLGQPSSFILKQVVSRNNLPCLDESIEESVCDACQQAKSHQLPYPKSFSTSKFSLELVFF
uniref:GAG-pre-integrase domain-containing protein n=1 Tax=Arundo donax TaxID=35708 RepID=A0A0A9A915_ARUDO